MKEIEINEEENEVEIRVKKEEMIGKERGWDMIMEGEVFYEKKIEERIIKWLKKIEERGERIIVGDKGRKYMNKERMKKIEIYKVQVKREIEEEEVKRKKVWEFIQRI